MGCVHSKRADPSPVLDYSSVCPPPLLPYSDRGSAVSSRHPSGPLNSIQKWRKDSRDGSRRRKEIVDVDKNVAEELNEDRNCNVVQNKKLKRRPSGGFSGPLSFKLGFSHRNVGAEQIAAGWPSWLSSAAAEAIQGWVPLKADAFQKLEKIGQGTYSSVFRAREVATGRMVALKKVRFDNFQPESIRFMAREILILRRLDHPNIIKLEGIITSRLSGSVYLVFEYMEHDLAGLSSSPEIKFSESQIKCYIKQLLCGIEHCHTRGVMHRDIKVSNILVNNDGILKIGDFGLANVLSEKNKHQLTSRVVTLWYRPPELLMGSTSYGVSVDLWSVGCVFAELLLGKPLFKGRTEVEQLHKIFKLCGSPSDEYWKQAKLSNATVFKPQHLYESSLQQRFKDYPTAADLIETFLSIEPEKRGTATSALLAQYFNTAPYACEPSNLPKYPPNKELDAKYREDVRRKMAGGRMRDIGAPRKPRRVNKTLQDQNNFNKFIPTKEVKENTQFVPKKMNDSNSQVMNGERGGMNIEKRSSCDTILEISEATKRDSVFTGPAPITASSGFEWAKRRQEDATSTLSCDQSISMSQISELDSSKFNFANSPFNFPKDEKQDYNEGMPKHRLPKQRNRNGRDTLGSFDSSNIYYFYDSKAIDEANGLGRNLGDCEEREKVEFSGPLLTQAYKMDEILQRNENQIRQATRRSRLGAEV
ncbi:cyclin-dependent kinase C-2 C-like [Euphorbia lathyris]|uniref:cyclin-dependent kinase C-2 C-like n=1 Tax=Euphorbia lathyris TaxID=212925 RepID=UPI00331408BB